MKIERYRFEKSILYKYTIYSFQYVDPYAKEYLRIYQLCHVIVMFVSNFIGFCVCYTSKKAEQANLDFKKNRHIVFLIRTMKIFWKTWYVLIWQIHL